MLISIVIPVLDDAQGLKRTLASLPSSPNLQIIVIDGGSSDETLEVIDAHAEIGYWESGQDTGIADAMNRGIGRAHGEYVAVLNAGDEWMPDTLPVVLETIEAHPGVDIVHGTIEYFDEHGHTHQVRPQVEKLGRRMWMFHPTMFVARACYGRIGVYDLSYSLAMDAEWCHRALAADASMVEIKQPLARMALGGRSDTRYRQALREFRRSAIAHRQATPFAAGFWYVLIVAGKTLARSPLVRQLGRRLLARA